MDGKKTTGYDKYIDWRLFVFPVFLLAAILVVPPLAGMRDVGTEYALGEKAVVEHLARELFGRAGPELGQWQILAVRMMEKSMRMGAVSRGRFLSRDARWCRSQGLAAEKPHLDEVRRFVSGMDDDKFRRIILRAAAVRRDQLKYELLSDEDRRTADRGIWNLQVALGMTVFVVFCFVTACIPLPMVAFCIGLLLVLSGVVTRTEVAALYWSDACWFIMGSLMFAAAFVKTGIDKRISLMLFSVLARPSVAAVTFVMIVVIAPLASFISDHALAAIFLPIAMILHRGGQGRGEAPDSELGKMLMITVAMACNIGGFGAPSGGARNVIMISYLNDMFGMDIGYFTWVTYGMPFVLIMIPITWFMIQRTFKPRTRDLGPAMASLKDDIARMGRWSRNQISAIAIFLAMLFFWFTEKSFYDMGIYPVRMGIGVIAIGGAVVYVLAGVVNWRDYQEKVDWGVVWLYAGAIIFGKILDETGAAYFLARSVTDSLAGLGFGGGVPLLGAGAVITGGITQIMADGPAAAAVGPVTLNMAGIVHPGTTMLPFMAMGTACASSFAYCLIIGTPPNAIVYASGVLSPRDYLRVGLPLWLIANAVLLLLVWAYWIPRGFAGLPAF